MRWLNVGKDKEVVYNLSKAQSALSKIPANKESLSCRHTLVSVDPCLLIRDIHFGFWVTQMKLSL